MTVSIRSSDLLARRGSEEFVVLAPGADGANAYQVAPQLLVSLADRVWRRRKGHLQLESPNTSAETAEILMARADNALYRAKVKARNRVEMVAWPATHCPLLRFRRPGAYRFIERNS